MNEKKYPGSFFRLMEDLTYANVKSLLKHGLYSYEEKKRLAYDIHKKHNTLLYNVKSVKCMLFFVKVQFIYTCTYSTALMHVEVNTK